MGRLTRNKEVEEMGEMFSIFKKVVIKILVLTTMCSMSLSAKFLKELCTRKVKYTDDAKFQVGEHVSVVLGKEMPTKCGNSVMFHIPCVIRTMKIENDIGSWGIYQHQRL